jgi:hypothetical protein
MKYYLLNLSLFSLLLSACGAPVQTQIYPHLLSLQNSDAGFETLPVKPRNFTIEYPDSGELNQYGSVSDLLFYLSVQETVDGHMSEQLALTNVMIPAYPGAEDELDDNVANALVIALDAWMQDEELTGVITSQQLVTWHGLPTLEIQATADPILVRALAVYPEDLQSDNGLIILMLTDPTYSDIDSFADFDQNGTISKILSTISF